MVPDRPNRTVKSSALAATNSSGRVPLGYSVGSVSMTATSEGSTSVICGSGSTIRSLRSPPIASTSRGILKNAAGSCHENTSTLRAMFEAAAFIPMPKRPMPLRLSKRGEPPNAMATLSVFGAMPQPSS